MPIDSTLGPALDADPASTHASIRASWRLLASLVALSVGSFLFVTTETLPIGLIDPISHDLGVSASSIGLLVTFYGLVVVVASVPLTYLTRNIPRRPLLSVLFAAYVTSSLASAVVDSYLSLLATRLVTAMSQAVFWSIVVPVTAGMFPEKVRGRVLSMVFAGGSLASVAGVPLGTWIGQHLGWRWAFVTLAIIGTVALGVVAAWLPAADTALTSSNRGTDPDRRRFWALVAMTALFSMGAFTFFTYLSPFLTDAVFLSAGLLSGVLLLRGLAGLAGVLVAGPLVDRRPRLAVALPAVVQVLALLLLFWCTGNKLLTVGLVALTRYTFAAFTVPLSARIMQVAPGRADLAASAISTAVNVGITLGALIGSTLLGSTLLTSADPGAGARSTALAGGLLTAAAVALLPLDRQRKV